MAPLRGRMGAVLRGAATVLPLLLLLLGTPRPAQAGDDDGGGVCALSEALRDPPCAHGGELLEGAGQPGACSECACPPGWAGVECEQCTTDAACQDSMVWARLPATSKAYPCSAFHHPARLAGSALLPERLVTTQGLSGGPRGLSASL